MKTKLINCTGTLISLLVFISLNTVGSLYAENQIIEVRHEVLSAETKAEIILSEPLIGAPKAYKDKNGIVITLRGVLVDPPKWKYIVNDKRVLEEIILSQSGINNAKIFFHVKNPINPIPYTITNAKGSRSVLVSLMHSSAPETSPILSVSKKPGKTQPKQKKNTAKQGDKGKELLPYEEPSAPPPPDTLALMLRTASSLAFIVGVIFLVGYLARKFFPKALDNINKYKNFKVIDKYYLGPRKQIALVSVYGKKILLGITPSQINFLVELDDPKDVVPQHPDEHLVKEPAKKEDKDKPFKKHLKKMTEEGKQAKPDEAATYKRPKVTVQDALLNLGNIKGDAPEAVDDVGSHKKSLENAINILHKKISQINETDQT